MDPGNYDPSTGAILALNTSTDTESGFIYDETDPYFQIPWDLAMSPDGSTLYVSNDQGGDTSGIFAINIKSPTYPIIGHTSVFKPESMTISSNGNYLYATYTSGEQPLVARIDTQAWLHSGDGLDHSGPYGDGTQDNSYITHIPLEYIGSGVALTPDQSQLFVAASNSFNGLQAVSDPAGASPTGRVVLSPNNYLIQGSNFIG
jgi:DNA-binding beta-propeller fold protein YncE